MRFFQLLCTIILSSQYFTKTASLSFEFSRSQSFTACRNEGLLRRTRSHLTCSSLSYSPHHRIQKIFSMPFPRKKPFDDDCIVAQRIQDEDDDDLPALIETSPTNPPALGSNASSYYVNAIPLAGHNEYTQNGEYVGGPVIQSSVPLSHSETIEWLGMQSILRAAGDEHSSSGFGLCRPFQTPEKQDPYAVQGLVDEREFKEPEPPRKYRSPYQPRKRST
jgi:hypothetical protein